MPSSAEQYLLRTIADRETQLRGPVPAILRGFLGGCAALYEIGLELYLALERVGLRRREKLPVPVLSIGNLSVGGTGKTPMTQRLCRLLAAQGKRVAILSRGHGGAQSAVRTVSDLDGNILLTASDSGDEPQLLAQSLPGIPVIVGKDRRESGREAVRRFSPDVLVLDDGFQFWQLARDLDIVLLDASHPFDNGYPLPRGLLREPKRHLKRARVVVATRAHRLDEVGREDLRRKISALAPKAQLYFAGHQAAAFVPVGNSSNPAVPLAILAEKRVVALSGIAQPQSFLDLLTQSVRADIVHSFAFDDHHRYNKEDAARVLQSARTHNADAVVMTEKDAVKWPEDGMQSEIPCYALRIEMQVEEEALFLANILRHLEL